MLVGNEKSRGFSRLFYSDDNALQICDGRAFFPLMLMRIIKLTTTTKLSAEHEFPPIANVLLWAALFIYNCLFEFLLSNF